MIVYAPRPMTANAIHWSCVAIGIDKISRNMTFKALVKSYGSSVVLSKLLIVLVLTLVNKIR